MTALSHDRNTGLRSGSLLVLDVAAGKQIFAGSLVVMNNGYAEPGSAALNLQPAGRAESYVDNRGGMAGAKKVTVKRGSQFKFANYSADPITVSRIGQLAYIVDDQSVAATNGNNTRSIAGRIWGVDSDGVWIELI